MYRKFRRKCLNNFTETWKIILSNLRKTKAFNLKLFTKVVDIFQKKIWESYQIFKDIFISEKFS